MFDSVQVASVYIWLADLCRSSRTQRRLQYFHLFLVVGVGSRHGIKGASQGENVPSIESATDVVEGTVSASYDRQRPEETGRVKDRIAEAQGWILYL